LLPCNGDPVYGLLANAPNQVWHLIAPVLRSEFGQITRRADSANHATAAQLIRNSAVQIE
jgi:hypothetical protein